MHLDIMAEQRTTCLLTWYLCTYKVQVLVINLICMLVVTLPHTCTSIETSKRGRGRGKGRGRGRGRGGERERERERQREGEREKIDICSYTCGNIISQREKYKRERGWIGNQYMWPHLGILYYTTKY